MLTEILHAVVVYIKNTKIVEDRTVIQKENTKQ